MLIKVVIFLNLGIVVINCYLLWKLIQFRNYLVNLNEKLLQINYNLVLILKEIPLIILMTGLEVQKFRHNYIKLQTKVKNTQKIIIITRFIYKIVQQKIV